MVATDGGSNSLCRQQTGWGVVVLMKMASGPPRVIAELYGPVTTDPDDEHYYIGSPSKDNDTAELDCLSSD